MTYTTVGVKLVGMVRYGARFVVLKRNIPILLKSVQTDIVHHELQWCTNTYLTNPNPNPKP